MRERCCTFKQSWRDGLPHTFACACTLRTGAYVVAALSIVYALLLAAAPWTIGVCGYRLCGQLNAGLAGELVAYVAASLLVLVSLVMVVGASTGRRELILPWLGFSSLYVVLWLMAGVIGFIVIAVHGAMVMATAAFFVSINMAVLPLYFLITVTALYVRIGEESREAAERALGGLTPPPALDADAAAPESAHDGNGPTL